MGASDIGHGYYGPEPWTHKKIALQGQRLRCKVRGSNPGATKKILDRIVHTMAHTIVRAIARTSMHTKTCMECMNKFYMECAHCMTDDGQIDV